MMLSLNTEHRSCKLPKINSIHKESFSNRKLISDSAMLATKHRFSHLISFRKETSQNNKKELEIKYHEYLNKKTHTSFRLNQIQNRINSITSLQDKYKIKFSSKEIRFLNIDKLESTAKEKYTKNLQLLAYMKIARWWKRKLIIKKMLAQNTRTENAVILIQNAWRTYIQVKNTKNLIKEMAIAQNKAALLIQKTYRGYQIRKKYALIIKEKKMEKIFMHFEHIRQQLYKESIKIIEDSWLVHKAQMRLNLHKKYKRDQRKKI